LKATLGQGERDGCGRLIADSGRTEKPVRLRR
jgi:hypothetical protein